MSCDGPRGSIAGACEDQNILKYKSGENKTQFVGPAVIVHRLVYIIVLRCTLRNSEFNI